MDRAKWTRKRSNAGLSVTRLDVGRLEVISGPCHPVPVLRSRSGGIWVGGGGLRLPGACKEGEAENLGFPPPEG